MSYSDIEPMVKTFFIWSKCNTTITKRADCPVCRHRGRELGLSTQFIKVPKVPILNGCEMVLCNHCGFITYDPMFNNILQYHKEQDALIGNTEQRFMIKNKIYYKNILSKMIGPGVYSKRTLDYGCGYGELSDLFSEYTGYDPNASKTAYYRLLKEKNISQFEDVVEGTYEFIMLNHVLDLVQDPRLTAEKMHSHLSDGGYLLIAQDTLNDINHPSLLPTMQSPKAFLNDERFNIFTKDLLISFIESIGFSLKDTCYTERGRFFVFQKAEPKTLSFHSEATKELFKTVFEVNALKLEMEKQTAVKPDIAVQVGKEALKRFPNWPDLIIRLSNIIDLIDGTDVLEDALKQNPEYTQLGLHVAFKYMQEDETDRAIEYLEKYMDSNPNSEKTIIHLAHSYVRAEQMDKLLELLRKHGDLFQDIGQSDLLGQLLKQL